MDPAVATILHADQGCQQPDWPGTDDQHAARLPERPSADRRDVLPRLRENHHRLEQNPEEAEALVHPHRILGFDSPALGHEPVHLLDASLGVTAVGAHVPFPHRAVRTGHGSGRRTIPTTWSPTANPLGPGSITLPSDSCPRIRRSRPGGAHPYSPVAISTSVPQTPTAIASTSTEPSSSDGSGTSSSRADPDVPGTTVTACKSQPPIGPRRLYWRPTADEVREQIDSLIGRVGDEQPADESRERFPVPRRQVAQHRRDLVFEAGWQPQTRAIGRRP